MNANNRLDKIRKNETKTLAAAISKDNDEITQNFVKNVVPGLQKIGVSGLSSTMSLPDLQKAYTNYVNTHVGSLYNSNDPASFGVRKDAAQQLSATVNNIISNGYNLSLKQAGIPVPTDIELASTTNPLSADIEGFQKAANQQFASYGTEEGQGSWWQTTGIPLAAGLTAMTGIGLAAGAVSGGAAGAGEGAAAAGGGAAATGTGTAAAAGGAGAAGGAAAGTGAAAAGGAAGGAGAATASTPLLTALIHSPFAGAAALGTASAITGIVQSNNASDAANKQLAQQQTLDNSMLSLGQQSLDYSKQWDQQQLQFAQQQLDQQLNLANQAISLAKSEDAQKQALVQQGLTNAQVTPDQYAQAAQQAAADQTQAYNNARQAQLVDMSRVGLNPLSPKYATTNMALRAQEAADIAGAETGARTGLQTLSKQMTANAINAGLGVPSAQLQATEAATGITNPAIGLQPQTTNAYNTQINTTGNLAANAGNMAMYYNQMGSNAMAAGLGTAGTLLGYGLQYNTNQNLINALNNRGLSTSSASGGNVGLDAIPETGNSPLVNSWYQSQSSLAPQSGLI